MLQYIIPSKTRRKIFALFFSNVDNTYHLRRVAREVDEEINAVKRELDILEKEKLLIKEKRLNKMIFSLNRKYPLFEEILRIMTKMGEFAVSFRTNISKLGKVKFIALSMKYVKNVSIREGEISVLLVGTLVMPEVAAIIGEEEKRKGKEINYTGMTEDEFVFRKRNNDPFIWNFLKGPKIMIVGEEDELLK
jgi:hypothetical protein